MFDENASWDWQNNEKYSLVDGELTNGGERQTVLNPQWKHIPQHLPPVLHQHHKVTTLQSNDETSEDISVENFFII